MADPSAASPAHCFLPHLPPRGPLTRKKVILLTSSAVTVTKTKSLQMQKSTRGQLRIIPWKSTRQVSCRHHQRSTIRGRSSSSRVRGAAQKLRPMVWPGRGRTFLSVRERVGLTFHRLLGVPSRKIIYSRILLTLPRPRLPPPPSLRVRERTEFSSHSLSSLDVNSSVRRRFALFIHVSSPRHWCVP